MVVSENKAIPVMYKPANVLETGANGNRLDSAAARRHPIDDMQRRQAAAPFGSLGFVRHVYGSGLAMRLATEQKIAREQELLSRAPGLEASNVYGEAVSGKDKTLDFADFLSLPENRPSVPLENPHLVMERRLGMF